LNLLDWLPCRGALLRGLSAGALLFWLPAASAQEVAVKPPEAAPSAPTRFSLGAGLGFVGYGDTGIGLLGTLSGFGPAQSRSPYGSALVEIEAAPLWRVVIGVAGTYNKMLSSDVVSTNPNALPALGPTNSWTFSGSVGVRRLLNPGGVVEVSPIVTVGGYRTDVNGIPTARTSSADGTLVVGSQDTTTKGYDARLGLVLERALLSNLFLRFESYFLRVGYGKSTSAEKSAETPQSSKREDLSIGYGFAPSVLLRLSF